MRVFRITFALLQKSFPLKEFFKSTHNDPFFSWPARFSVCLDCLINLRWKLDSKRNGIARVACTSLFLGVWLLHSSLCHVGENSSSCHFCIP